MKILFLPTKHTVQSPLLPQEPNLSLRVAAYEADNDSLLLATLEPVHRTQFNTGMLFL